MDTNVNPKDDIGSALGVDGPSQTRGFSRRKVVGGVIAVFLVLAVVLWFSRDNGQTYDYKTQNTKKGDLTVTVSATGNLEPINQVDVGSELSGIVRTVTADYNDRVQQGQVLAELDTDKLEAQVQQSRATLKAAQAKVLQASATVAESRSALARLNKVKELSGGKVPSRNDLESAEAAFERAQADLASAEAQVSQTEATLKVNETDMAKAVIRSPINGIVLARSVEPGQTVAASLQAPVLFTLAEDLTKMELHVGVDEADVGEVRESQEATFTVDAYPDRRFPARVSQVRYGSETSGGVVTYKAVLGLDNSDLLLRPGMTATADIVVKKLTGALLVPNAALRFTPPTEEKDAKESASNSSMISKLFPRPPRGSEKSRKDNENPRNQTVWILKDKKLVSLKVTTGATDGTMTEVTGGDVAPGMALIVDAVSKKE
ncbi:MAG TPA: efflux RND transporter periplasmic adaptor subunit [Desulfomonilia bacterium]|nr:efflux RND transporter periplasmic adaptor subunit [Desulfomonilia bacterium]